MIQKESIYSLWNLKVFVNDIKNEFKWKEMNESCKINIWIEEVGRIKHYNLQYEY